MKPTFFLSTAIMCLASFALANPVASNNDISAEEYTENVARDSFDTLKGCSGQRKGSDKCSGKRFGPQNSFHNCANRGGKCCAKNKNGSGGLEVRKGQGREDCGFCFSGNCKG